MDNVLNKIMDPLQVGYQYANKLDASLKTLIKRSADEKVGVVCKKNGKFDIVEYSELSAERACLRKNPDDEDDESLKFELGSILIFMLSAKKLIDLSCNTSTLNQLYHRAHKKVDFYDDEKGELVKPDAPNAHKFELFLHNFLPFVGEDKCGVLSVKREDEFAPVKNANPEPDSDQFPEDTPQIACALINMQHSRWVQEALTPEEYGRLFDLFDGKQVEVDFMLSYGGEGAVFR